MYLIAVQSGFFLGVDHVYILFHCSSTPCVVHNVQCNMQSEVQIYPGGGWTSMQGSPKTFAFANFKFTTSGASKIAFKSENPEFKFLDLKVSQSLFVNIYQRHTVLNVISDRRQFTLKLIRE